jgi:hypothetical protein
MSCVSINIYIDLYLLNVTVTSMSDYRRGFIGKWIYLPLATRNYN